MHVSAKYVEVQTMSFSPVSIVIVWLVRYCDIHSDCHHQCNDSRAEDDQEEINRPRGVLPAGSCLLGLPGTESHYVKFAMFPLASLDLS